MIFGDRKRRTLHWAEAFGASAVVHLGAAVLAFDLLPELPDPQLPEPEIEIGIILLDDEMPQTQLPDSNAPLVEEPVEPEEPEDPPVVAETPDPEPEEPETQTEETEPQVAEGSNEEPEVLAPVGPDTPQVLSPTTVAPQTATTLRPENGAAIPVAPTTSVASTTLSGQQGTVITAAPVSAVTPSNGASVSPRSTLPSPLPTPTVQAPTPDGTTAGGAVGELITRIRGQLSNPCLLAIPQQGADGVPELVLIGSDEAAMGAFANAVLDGLTPAPTQRRVLTDSRQCAALNYVRENQAYPTFRLALELEETTVATGETLNGRITNTAGRYISLLLVDDNGVVSDLGDDLSFTANAARFNPILSRTGPARDTSPLLIALATAARPATLNPQNGQLAADYFPALAEEIGVNIPMVLGTFDVR